MDEMLNTLQARFRLALVTRIAYIVAVAICMLMVVAGASAEHVLRYETASLIGSVGVGCCLFLAIAAIGLHGGRGTWLVLPLLLSFIGPAAILAFVFHACLGDGHACL